MNNSKNKKLFFIFLILLIIFLFSLYSKRNNDNLLSDSNSSTYTNYPLHENISVTLFWVGEKASSENNFISNAQSAWDDKWKEHSINENSFYFALPYNDFENGNRKTNSKEIYWYREKDWNSSESVCKNQWIKITKGNLIAYAQWEDVGPFGEDDFNYVFGNNSPKSEINNHAGLDVSPAIHDYLNLQDVDLVSWQFVNSSDVPEGPWKKAITSSQIYWE